MREPPSSLADHEPLQVTGAVAVVPAGHAVARRPARHRVDLVKPGLVQRPRAGHLDGPAPAPGRADPGGRPARPRPPPRPASLDERLALGGPRDELTELADTFDGLLARLEAAFAAQRQFIANAAHEMRTPLARQRVISQVALADPDASIESLRAAHERALASGAQQQLIDALLTLARGQAGLDQHEPFDLAGLVSKILADRQPKQSARTSRCTRRSAQHPLQAAPAWLST